MYDIASSVLDVSGRVLVAAGDLIVASGERRELDPNIVKPGWVALLIFVAMAVTLALLMWSFARISRRARDPWEGEAADEGDRSPDSPAAQRRDDA
ncbi:hypothetical protein [Aeromicrobium sp. Sec7.5]|uniref:hypothetical protein n=1 Tax=Aeromicrobium sp. Sec7.5 TaxID=3121276 RepID=UPI002FE4F728